MPEYVIKNGELYRTDDLQHGLFKYIKREWVKGKWKYWYDDDTSKSKTTKFTKTGPFTKTKMVPSSKQPKPLSTITSTTKKSVVDDVKKGMASAIKKSIEKNTKKAIEVANKLPAIANKAYDKIIDVANKLYDDPKNIYDVTSNSYTTKKAKIEKTKEWQDIVKTKNPEYVKTTSDGKTTYDIDKYMVDKKHPVLDAINDIASGRKISVNEITKDSTVAGVKDLAYGVVATGMILTKVATTILTEKHKLRQGSYDDEIQSAVETINKGRTYVEKQVGIATRVATSEDAEKLISMANSDRAKQAADVARAIDKDNVVQATKIILQSEDVQSRVGDSQYYKTAENVLTNLSEEEIIVINAVLKQIRGK